MKGKKELNLCFVQDRNWKKSIKLLCGFEFWQNYIVRHRNLFSNFLQYHAKTWILCVVYFVSVLGNIAPGVWLFSVWTGTGSRSIRWHVVHTCCTMLGCLSGSVWVSVCAVLIWSVCVSSDLKSPCPEFRTRSIAS